METYGAQVVASPSPDDELRARRPRRDARLARARWAWRSARRSRTPRPATTRSTRSGSVLNHVLLHQTVIGLEALEQMAMAGEEPDVIIACAGGGSNFAGLDVPVPRPQAARRGRLPGHRGRARGGAVADPRRLRLRLRRHRPAWRRSSRCTPSATSSSPSRSTPAACATTAWRRSCRCSRSTGVIEARSVHQRAVLRGRRPVRPDRGHPAGAREHPRDQGRGRRGARGEGGRRVAGDPVQPVAATATSTCRRTSATCQGALEDYEYPAEKVAAGARRPARRSADDAGRAAVRGSRLP